MRCINKPQSRIIRCIIGLDFLPINKAPLSFLPHSLISNAALFFLPPERLLLFRSPCLQLCGHYTSQLSQLDSEGKGHTYKNKNRKMLQINSFGGKKKKKQLKGRNPV